MEQLYKKIPIEEFNPVEGGKAIVCFNIFEHKLDKRGEKTEELVFHRSHIFETPYKLVDSKVVFPAIIPSIETITHVIIPIN